MTTVPSGQKDGALTLSRTTRSSIASDQHTQRGTLNDSVNQAMQSPSWGDRRGGQQDSEEEDNSHEEEEEESPSRTQGPNGNNKNSRRKRPRWTEDGLAAGSLPGLRHPVYRDYAYVRPEQIMEERHGVRSTSRKRPNLAAGERGGGMGINGLHRRNSTESVTSQTSASIPNNNNSSAKASSNRLNFPLVFHQIMDGAVAGGYTHICSWQPHGRAFRIHDKDRFEEQILTTQFRNKAQFASFQRQLNLYGFNRLTLNNDDKGAYYHQFFLRGRPDLTIFIRRARVKGTGVRRPIDPASEPLLWQLPFLPEVNGGAAASAATESVPPLLAPAPVDSSPSALAPYRHSAALPPPPPPSPPAKTVHGDDGQRMDDDDLARCSDHHHHPQMSRTATPHHDDTSMVHSDLLDSSPLPLHSPLPLAFAPPGAAPPTTGRGHPDAHVLAVPFLSQGSPAHRSRDTDHQPVEMGTTHHHSMHRHHHHQGSGFNPLLDEYHRHQNSDPLMKMPPGEVGLHYNSHHSPPLSLPHHHHHLRSNGHGRATSEASFTPNRHHHHRIQSAPDCTRNESFYSTSPFRHSLPSDIPMSRMPPRQRYELPQQAIRSPSFAGRITNHDSVVDARTAEIHRRWMSGHAPPMPPYTPSSHQHIMSRTETQQGLPPLHGSDVPVTSHPAQSASLLSRRYAEWAKPGGLSSPSSAESAGSDSWSYQYLSRSGSRLGEEGSYVDLFADTEIQRQGSTTLRRKDLEIKFPSKEPPGHNRRNHE